MAVQIGHAGSDENGGISGGKAGDQKQHGTPDHTGEVYMRDWWLHSLGWRVFRCKDPKKADMIAQDMEWACDNPNIGYDQSQNQTLFYAAEKVDFDCRKVCIPCETDCARLVRVCVLYAGIPVSDFYTGIEAQALMATGQFEELTETKYTTSSDYLKRGDILVTRRTGHTCVVLTNGSKAVEVAPVLKIADAERFNKDIAGTYQIITDLYLRTSPLTGTAICVMKQGKTCRNYGYYSDRNGTKWFLVIYGNKKGFCSSKYLKKV